MEINSRKKVSCHVITYNHINYISQCLDGILMQKTAFDFEIIIGDDLSDDGTRELVQQYADKYPDLIKLNLREKRGIGIPGKENFVSTLNMCHGEYISLCDGDDYWTDPLKLQKQVDFLEANKDYVLCFHKVDILQPDGKIVADFITKIPTEYRLRENIINNANYIHSPTVLFRNLIRDEINSLEFQKSPIGDYFIYTILTQYGKIGFLDMTMAVYRFGAGVYSSLNNLKMITADALLFVNLYSFEKDTTYRNVFYNNIINTLSGFELVVKKLENENKLLKTRRHIFIEKIYKLFK